MYTSLITYAMLLALLVWGGKWGKKGSEAIKSASPYNDDFMSLNATLSVRGLAALGVLLHHISQEKAFQNASQWPFGGGCLSLFNGIGYLFVAVFFFCSGYGLVKSLNSKSGYLDTFMQKRLPALIVPFYVNTILYAIARYAHHDKMTLLQWIVSFLGLSLMNRFAWYAVVIVILYIVFYITFRHIKNNIKRIAIVTAAVLLQGASFCVIGHFAWWAGKPNWYLSPGALQTAPWWKGMMVTWFHGEWWVNSSIAFPLGLAFAIYEKQVLRFIKARYWTLFTLSIALAAGCFMLSRFAQRNISYWSEFAGRGPGIGNKAVCYAVQILEVSSFIAFLFMFLMKYRTINPVTKLFGNLSLETYLMQPVTLMVLSPISSQKYLAPYIASNILLTVLLAILFKWINTAVLSAIKRQRSASA